MGLHLIGFAGPVASIAGILWGTWIVVLVILGLNFVILVHELGHFLVAKLCGVKCEKFYIWFDAFGFRLGRFRWGETEYGVGWLPLGGYVKMLGQEDNPARLREEIARASATGGPDIAKMPGRPHWLRRRLSQPMLRHSADPSQTIDVAAAEQALYDPRSYLAQSVPKRMAIISAGVIMNVIFAFLLAVWAYGLGVFQMAGAVGAVAPGGAAWQANLQVGDQVLEINGKPIERFTDLRNSVSLGDLANGLTMRIQRPGVQEPFSVTVEPDKTDLYPTIGVVNALETTLAAKFPAPAHPGTAAAEAQPGFRGGDKIVAIDGTPVTQYVDIHRQLALHPDKPLQWSSNAKRRPPATARSPGRSRSPRSRSRSCSRPSPCTASAW